MFFFFLDVKFTSIKYGLSSAASIHHNITFGKLAQRLSISLHEAF